MADALGADVKDLKQAIISYEKNPEGKMSEKTMNASLLFL